MYECTCQNHTHMYMYMCINTKSVPVCYIHKYVSCIALFVIRALPSEPSKQLKFVQLIVLQRSVTTECIKCG